MGIGGGPQEHIDITYKTFKFSVKYDLKEKGVTSCTVNK